MYASRGIPVWDSYYTESLSPSGQKRCLYPHVDFDSEQAIFKRGHRNNSTCERLAEMYAPLNSRVRSRTAKRRRPGKRNDTGGVPSRVRGICSRLCPTFGRRRTNTRKTARFEFNDGISKRTIRFKRNYY